MTIDTVSRADGSGSLATVVAKTWLITGVTSGLGRALARAALDRGDTVAGLVRTEDARTSFEALAPARALGFVADVVDAEAVNAAVREVEARTGGVSILVNNAGQVLTSTVEDLSPPELRRLMEVNLLGPLNLLRAVLPFMRQRRAGRIFNISSAGGMVGVAALGGYCATKFALEGLTEALSAEVAPLGITATIVEPGSFRTQLLARSQDVYVPRHTDYDGTAGAVGRSLARGAGHEPNDPDQYARIMLELADTSSPPRRLAIGADALRMVDDKIRSIQSDLAPWRDRCSQTRSSD